MRRASRLSWPDKLRAIRKLMFREDPYMLISIKPKDMIRTRPESHEIAVLRDLFEARLQNYASLLGSIGRHRSDAESAYRDIGHNNFFNAEEAFLAFSLLRELGAKRVIEIGSGNSSMVFRAAGGDQLDLTCVDPEPRRAIERVASTVIRKSVLDVPVEFFSKLSNNDILFIDGSHYCFNGTDVTYLFLEVLPRLNSGVVVHVHDIYLPYEYTEEMSRRHYNEQYVLGALLVGDGDWQTLFPMQFCYRKGLVADGSSFWIRRS